MHYRVLIIDDEHLIRISLREGLRDAGYRVESAETIQEGLALIEQFKPDVVLLDNCLGEIQGKDYIGAIKKLDEDIQLIMITAYGFVSQAVEVIKLGAYDYVQKPFDIEEIDITIQRAMEGLSRRRQLSLISEARPTLVGESPQMLQIKKQIDILAHNDNVDVLVRGETGTGKEVVVNLIHSTSARSGFPLVKINCGAIPDSLLESELFGYEKGAFTGALKTKKGLIEWANGGTVFLDEIGELPLLMQTKLLSFLEDRKFKRVGGLVDIEVNVRVVAATNRHLEKAIETGLFRQDLFYRLNVMQIHLPPLRERREDIEPLSALFLEHFNRKLGKNVTGIAPEFLHDLTQYPWKGNVRELKNVLERAVLFCEGNMLEDPGQLFEEWENSSVTKPSAPQSGQWPLKDLSRPIDLQKEVESFELAYIRKALALCGGNHSKAAELLGCTRFTLRRRLDRI